MSIWKRSIDIDEINKKCVNTLVQHLDIRVIEIGDDYLKASMPVNHKTHQPTGILHGGASVALAETAGSIAAQLVVEPDYFCVGLEVNANHILRVTEGIVVGTAKPIHLGRSTQVWDVTISDENHQTVCVSRLTMSVLKAQGSRGRC